MNKMMLTCRLVEDSDLPIICSFPQSAQELYFMFPKAVWPLTVDQLAQAIRQRFESTVLLAGADVVGFANYYICEPGQTCSIGNVIVSPQVRGKGAGKYLVETMTATAFDKYHVKQVEISCFNQNVTGLLLYTKLGFTPYSIEERMSADGNRAALIHMQLEKKEKPELD
jgi:ribosomal protein S18 acetylase RimI-like enzyme